MSWLGPAELRQQYRSPASPPTFWCVTCQLSLRNEGERIAHTTLFPAHLVKGVARLPCPGCGNDIPLENGRYSEHWIGDGADAHQCRGSGKRA